MIKPEPAESSMGQNQPGCSEWNQPGCSTTIRVASPFEATSISPSLSPNTK